MQLEIWLESEQKLHVATCMQQKPGIRAFIKMNHIREV